MLKIFGKSTKYSFGTDVEQYVSGVFKRYDLDGTASGGTASLNFEGLKRKI